MGEILVEEVISFAGWTICSMSVIELTLSTSVDGSDHVGELALAHIHTRTLSEEAIIEPFLVNLCVVWRVSDRLTILFFCVAPPHSVDGLFAGQEVIALLSQHLGVTDINTYDKTMSM